MWLSGLLIVILNKNNVFGFGLQQAIVSFDKQNLIRNADSILSKSPKDKDQIIFIENHQNVFIFVLEWFES